MILRDLGKTGLRVSEVGVGTEHLGRETILYLEKGKYNPSLQLAHDIAKALKTTMTDLFIFED